MRNRTTGVDEEYLAILHDAGYDSPTPLQRWAIPRLAKGDDVALQAGHGTGRTLAFLLPIVLRADREQGGMRHLILASSQTQVRKILREYRRCSRSLSSRPTIAALGVSDDAGWDSRALADAPDIVVGMPDRVSEHLRHNEMDLRNLEYLVVDLPAWDSPLRNDVKFIRSRAEGKHQIAVFCPTLEGESLSDLVPDRKLTFVAEQQWRSSARTVRQPVGGRGAGEGRREMRTEKSAKDKQNSVDEEALKRKIDEILHTITMVEDPQLMNRLKRIYKRYVPLHRRAYFSAYLLSQIAERGGGQRQMRREASSSAGGSSSQGEFARLFVSVGKRRRVYPRDLYEHFTRHLNMERERMGEAKVLDNYSFVEIDRAYAERAIQEITGTELKGKKLTVNYARSREDRKR